MQRLWERGGMGTILVTGSAGFIGWKVADLLLARGYQVLGVDNMNPVYDVRLKEWRISQLVRRERFEFTAADVLDSESIAGIISGRGVEAVINLAARAGVRPSVLDPDPYMQTNTMGTLSLLKLCVEHDIDRFILASTSSLYGASKDVPFRESSDTDRCLSPYAASKKAAEALAHTYHHLYGLNVTVFRYFTVYGPAGRPDMSPFRFVQWISEGRPLRVWGDGKQARDFTYVDDIAEGTIAALGLTGFETINLGAGRELVLMEAIRILEDLIGKRALIEHHPSHKADVPKTLAAVDRAAELLDWKAQIAFEEGAARLVDWYKENRAWASAVDTSD